MGCEQFDQLPEVIRSLYTEEEYLWMSDEDKRTLIQRETEPECE